MVGKNKNMLRALSLLTLLMSLVSINHPAYASPDEVDQVSMQIIGGTLPELPDITQSEPTVSLVVASPTINIGEMTTVTVNLNNVPVEGYTSIELTCSYYPDLVEAGDIAVADLFGPDPVVAIRDPQYDRFIVAIAGSHGNKATSSGTVMTFHLRAWQAGQSPMECQARASTGNQALTSIASLGNNVIILAPTLTSTTGLCDSAEFVADVTIPPGTVMSPGETFRKTWRLTNVGTCTWTQSYQLMFSTGTPMSAAFPVNFPISVSPGQTVDVSLDMIAPITAGSYTGNWLIHNPKGNLFGIGASANEPFSVNIIVSNTSTPSVTVSPSPSASPIPSITSGGPTATTMGGVAYDFTASACQAKWFSGVDPLPCPGIDGNPNGFVLLQDHPVMETGSISPQHGLLTVPQDIQNGYIQGFYPPINVQNGDRFRTIINCEYGATNCYAAFRLDYQIGSEPIRAFWGPYLERYEGRFDSIDVDLSPLADKDVKFMLTILAAGSPTGDRAEWVNPIIYRPSLTANTATLTPTTSADSAGTATPRESPTITTTPTETPAPPPTFTPGPSPTATPLNSGILMGKVIASKPVRINLFTLPNDPFDLILANSDGTFSMNVPPGTYIVSAYVPGFLPAQKTVIISVGNTTTLPTISLLAGDVDTNFMINELDALTIGMNYNMFFPQAADLNNDGTINVLDLELLAKNYRKTGPTVWQ